MSPRHHATIFQSMGKDAASSHPTGSSTTRSLRSAGDRKNKKLPANRGVRNDPRGINWVSMSGKIDLSHLNSLPVEGGKETDGTPLFIARAHHNGGIHPGKVVPHLHGARISWDGREVTINEYEVLQISAYDVRWVPASGKLQPYPNNRLVEAGKGMDGSPLFIARAHYNGGVYPGKAGPRLPGAYIPWGGKEVIVDKYEILQLVPTGSASESPAHGMHWVSTSGFLNPASLNARPVEFGREKDGTPLFVARAHYNDGVHPGKAGLHIRGAHIGWGGREVIIDSQYEVLCYD